MPMTNDQLESAVYDFVQSLLEENAPQFTDEQKDGIAYATQIAFSDILKDSGYKNV